MEKPNRLSLTFAVARAQSAPGDEVRFSGVAYSGGVIPAYGWHGDVAIDLDSLQNPDGDSLPVLENHDGRIEAIAGRGVINRFVNEDGIAELRIEGALTSATEAGRRVAQLLAEGFPLQLSVGMTANLRETSEPIQINGQTLKVAAVFENALIRECSFVPVGADPDTKVARLSFHDFQPAKEQPMTRSPEDAALIEGLQAKVEELEARLAALRDEKRAAELAALFDTIGRDLPQGDALKPYLSMDDAAFAVFAADLKSVAAAAKPKADGALFSSVATKKAADEDKRREAVSLSAAVERLIKTA